MEGIEIKKKIDPDLDSCEWKKNHDSKESTQETYMSDVGRFYFISQDHKITLFVRNQIMVNMIKYRLHVTKL